MSGLMIEKLSMRFDLPNGSHVQALKDVSLDLAEGELMSVLGPSGCGKTTLLNIVAGFLAPTSGEIQLNGHDVTGPDAERGMVFQQDAVFPWMTVAKNISYGPRLRGASKAEQSEIEAKWTEMVGLRGFEDRWPRELSGGMRKRVDIGRVYANDPDVLLMDEPFGALDAQTKERMQSDLLTTWQKSKKTVVFVTHDIEEAIFLSDKIIVLSSRPGRVHHIEEVSLPRPRNDEMRLTEEFLAIKRRLWGMLDH